MHRDQIHVDAAIVRGLIDDQFPQFRAEEIVSVNSERRQLVDIGLFHQVSQRS